MLMSQGRFLRLSYRMKSSSVALSACRRDRSQSLLSPWDWGVTAQLDVQGLEDFWKASSLQSTLENQRSGVLMSDSSSSGVAGNREVNL